MTVMIVTGAPDGIGAELPLSPLTGNSLPARHARAAMPARIAGCKEAP